MSEERAFLTAILEEPDDDIKKLVYADWLEEQGDPRAEYLRLMIKARQDRAVTPEQRQLHDDLSTELAELLAQESLTAPKPPTPEVTVRRQRISELKSQLTSLSEQLRQPIPTRLQQLAASLDPHWLAIVSDAGIESCGKSGVKHWPFRFDYLCDQSWADMESTDQPTIRHCDRCRENVYFCDNLADAREHAMAGNCIAVEIGIIRREDDLRPPIRFRGRPSKADVRSTYEMNIDPVSQARLDAKKSGNQQTDPKT